MKKLLIGIGIVVVLAAGFSAIAWNRLRDRPTGALDTQLKGVTVVRPTSTAEPPRTTTRGSKSQSRATSAPRGGSYRFLPVDRLCWKNFGRDSRRTLALPDSALGKPTRYFWARGLRSYIEYPPSYCDGRLYVNTFRGVTYAINAHNGKVVWRRGGQGHKPSTPAIAGKRLIVSSTDGTVTALHRQNGRLLWRFRVARAKVESSPVVVDGLVYFGATDGRLFALDVRNGSVRWAYDTGGRINSSPSISGPRVCITTYAGSIFCLLRRDGRKLWSRYLKRDFLRYESFYASASTDGLRLFTIARSGNVYCLNARSGRVVWTQRVGGYGYSTPAVANGRVFVGGFDGALRAFRSTTGRLLWRRYVGGRILGPAFVVGGLVFFSTLEEHTYAVRATNGKIVWHVRMGKYSPGIATDRHYFFSLNGILLGFHAQNPARYKEKP